MFKEMKCYYTYTFLINIFVAGKQTFSFIRPASFGENIYMMFMENSEQASASKDDEWS